MYRAVDIITHELTCCWLLPRSKRAILSTLAAPRMLLRLVAFSLIIQTGSQTERYPPYRYDQHYTGMLVPKKLRVRLVSHTNDTCNKYEIQDSI